MDLNYATGYNYAKYMGMHLFFYGIEDIFIVYHSPAGCKKKAEFTLSPHDLFFSEHHYFDNYINNVESVFGTEESLIQALRTILSKKEIKCIAIITTDVPEIIGFDYSQVLFSVSQDFPKTTFLSLHGQAIGGDLHLGYQESLYECLKVLPRKEKGVGRKEGFNILGYFFHRYEGDTMGDIKELQNMLEGIGVNLNTLLPGKTRYDELVSLPDVGDTIVFTPYASDEIQSYLEGELSQRVYVLDVPIGIYYTKKFLETIAPGETVKQYIDKQLGEIIPKAQVLLPVLLGKRFALVGDTQRLIGLLDLYCDVGMVPVVLISTDSLEELSSKTKQVLQRYSVNQDVKILSAPARDEVIEIINNEAYELDLIVGSSVEKQHLKREIAFLEYFFPLHTKHYINFYPILGFTGVLNILSDTYNCVNTLEYYNLSNSLASLMGDFTFYHTGKRDQKQRG